MRVLLQDHSEVRIECTHDTRVISVLHDFLFNYRTPLVCGVCVCVCARACMCVHVWCGVCVWCACVVCMRACVSMQCWSVCGAPLSGDACGECVPLHSMPTLVGSQSNADLSHELWWSLVPLAILTHSLQWGEVAWHRGHCCPLQHFDNN